jgi:hypothetical protein
LAVKQKLFSKRIGKNLTRHSTKSQNRMPLGAGVGCVVARTFFCFLGGGCVCVCGWVGGGSKLLAQAEGDIV